MQAAVRELLAPVDRHVPGGDVDVDDVHGDAVVAMRPTDELTGAELSQVRELLDIAFGPEFSPDDWAHTIGGHHALVREHSQLVAHASVVPRTLVAGSRALAVGYVEGVATRPDARGHGHATRALLALHALLVRQYELGALSTGVPQLYARLGWETWRGPTWVDGPDGRARTEDDDGGVMVLRTPATPLLDLDAPLTCDWREGDVW